MTVRASRYAAGRSQRAAGLVAVFLLSLGGSAAVSLVAGIPEPSFQDEFSYLLAADTYSRGRLAMPPHPQADHFQVPHVISRPAYASKYQPAQGMALALGTAVTGHPVAGVWLSVALMTATITWMLGCWLPWRWALIGGVLTALQFGVAGLWAQSYWGGALAAMGGALVFGSFRRIRDSTAWGGVIALAVGCSLLAVSRPYEGLVVVAIALVSWLVSQRRAGSPIALRRVLTALGISALLTGSFLARFNSAVTGSAMTMPYVLHSRQYDVAPLFLFQPARPVPAYSYDHLERFHVEYELPQWRSQQSLRGYLAGVIARSLVAVGSYGFGPPRWFTADLTGRRWLPGLLLLPLLLLPHLSRRRWSVYAMLVVGLVFASLSAATYFISHYLAVLAGILMFLVVEAVRLLRAILRRTWLRRAIVPLIVAYATILAAVWTVDQRRLMGTGDLWFQTRDALAASLEALGGRHLVLVTYDSDYSVHRFWTYNTADIDGQPVVWAAALDSVRDGNLLEYYADRSAWSLTLEPDEPPRLSPIRSRGSSLPAGSGSSGP